MDHRVTKEERRLIYFMRQEGDGIGEIARRLGRAGSTISRELRRNRGQRGYRYRQADARAQARTKRVVHRRFTPAMKDGKPVAGVIRVPISFDMDDEEMEYTETQSRG